jgi:hypothetical protein
LDGWFHQGHDRYPYSASTVPETMPTERNVQSRLPTCCGNRRIYAASRSEPGS